MSKRHKKWFFLWILLPVIGVGIFLLLSINYLIDPSLYRNVIQKSLTLNLGREVTIGKAKISLWGGFGVAFEDFRVKDRSLKFDLLQSKRLILNVKLVSLLRREIRWKRIVLERPIFRLLRDKNGRFNFSEGPLTGENLKAFQQKMLRILSTLFGGSITLQNGDLFLSDESLADSPVNTEIRSFHIELSDVSYYKPFPFRLYGEIAIPTKKVNLTFLESSGIFLRTSISQKERCRPRLRSRESIRSTSGLT